MRRKARGPEVTQPGGLHGESTGVWRGTATAISNSGRSRESAGTIAHALALRRPVLQLFGSFLDHARHVPVRVGLCVLGRAFEIAESHLTRTLHQRPCILELRKYG